MGTEGGRVSTDSPYHHWLKDAIDPNATPKTVSTMIDCLPYLAYEWQVHAAEETDWGLPGYHRRNPYGRFVGMVLLEGEDPGLPDPNKPWGAYYSPNPRKSIGLIGYYDSRAEAVRKVDLNLVVDRYVLWEDLRCTPNQRPDLTRLELLRGQE